MTAKGHPFAALRMEPKDWTLPCEHVHVMWGCMFTKRKGEHERVSNNGGTRGCPGDDGLCDSHSVDVSATEGNLKSTRGAKVTSVSKVTVQNIAPDAAKEGSTYGTLVVPVNPEVRTGEVIRGDMERYFALRMIQTGRETRRWR